MRKNVIENKAYKTMPYFKAVFVINSGKNQLLSTSIETQVLADLILIEGFLT